MMKAGWLLAATVVGLMLIAPIALPLDNGYSQVHTLSNLFIKFLSPPNMPGLNVTGDVNVSGVLYVSSIGGLNLSAGNTTFPPSSCSGTDKVTAINLTGQVVCGTDYDTVVNAYTKTESDGRYAPIVWAYNQTTAAITFIQNWVNANFYTKTEVDATAANLNSTYGGMHRLTIDTVLASSVNTTAGNVTSGNLTSLQVYGGVSYTVQETGKFNITVNFTGMTRGIEPSKLSIAWWYDGSGTHDIFLLAYNYATGNYDRLTTANRDFPAGTAIVFSSFLFPLDASNYVSNGNASIRLSHTSGAVSSHYFYLDWIGIEQKTIKLPTAMLFTNMGGNMTSTIGNGFTWNATDQTLMVDKAGTYHVMFTHSAAGKPNARVYFSFFTNHAGHGSVSERSDYLEATTRFDTEGNIKELAFTGFVYLHANDSVTVKVAGQEPNTWVAGKNAALTLERVGS